METRLKKLGIGLLFIIMLGIIYAMFIFITGYSIPCIIKYITHLNCPTCGITRQIISILRFDIESAIKFNIVLFYAYPFLLIFSVYYLYRYIKYGILKFNLFLTIYFVSICLVFLVWAIVRNIYGI